MSALIQSICVGNIGSGNSGRISIAEAANSSSAEDIVANRTDLSLSIPKNSLRLSGFSLFEVIEYTNGEVAFNNTSICSITALTCRGEMGFLENSFQGLLRETNMFTPYPLNMVIWDKRCLRLGPPSSEYIGIPRRSASAQKIWFTEYNVLYAAIASGLIVSSIRLPAYVVLRAL